MVHLRYIGRKNEKDRTDPSVGRSRVRECGISGHVAPPTEAREGCSGLVGDGRLCAVHASSMVESTADDHLTVDGDANVCRERRALL